MLKCSTSLWSADLTNLESEIKRVEPYSERFHLDVADGHYTPTMLFFPDLVAAMRPHTRVPFEVHIMSTNPLDWVDPFIDAGADGILLCFDSLDDHGAAIERVRSKDKFAGLALRLDEDPSLLDPYWNSLAVVCLVGTEIGIKGAEMDSRVPERIQRARACIRAAGAATEIECDGGIRRHTVPVMNDAGADWIVPGSLMFKENPAEMREWLASL
jgi:ribulose-phosphate 3-epimerase